MVFMVYDVLMNQGLAHIPKQPDIQSAQAILTALPNAEMIQIAGQQYTLPQGIREQLMELLTLNAEGKASAITALNTELSSQEAADYLRVSRQFLVNEADAGRIAYRKIGTHRRFALPDVLAYQRMTEQESLEARQALVDQAQELGWDD